MTCNLRHPMSLRHPVAKTRRKAYLHWFTWHDRNPYVFELCTLQFSIFATHSTGWRRRRGCRNFTSHVPLQVISRRTALQFCCASKDTAMALCRPAQQNCRVILREMTCKGTWPVKIPLILRVKIRHPMALCRISIKRRHPMTLYWSFPANEPYN